MYEEFFHYYVHIRFISLGNISVSSQTFINFITILKDDDLWAYIDITEFYINITQSR